MSEVTGRCAPWCGLHEFHVHDAEDEDWIGDGGWFRKHPTHPAAIGTFCWQCGRQLLPEGRTQAPATEDERADARRFKALNGAKGLCVFPGHNGPVVSYLAGPYYGPPEKGGTLADAVDAYMADHPQE